jgi:hypothetical protein
MLGGDAPGDEGLLSEPSAETGGQQYLPVPRRPRVSLIPSPLRKRTNVPRQEPFQRLREDHVVIDDALHNGSFLSIARVIEGANYAEFVWV